MVSKTDLEDSVLWKDLYAGFPYLVRTQLSVMTGPTHLLHLQGADHVSVVHDRM